MITVNGEDPAFAPGAIGKDEPLKIAEHVQVDPTPVEVEHEPAVK